MWKCTVLCWGTLSPGLLISYYFALWSPLKSVIGCWPLLHREVFMHLCPFSWTCSSENESHQVLPAAPLGRLSGICCTSLDILLPGSHSWQPLDFIRVFYTATWLTPMISLDNQCVSHHCRELFLLFHHSYRQATVPSSVDNVLRPFPRCCYPNCLLSWANRRCSRSIPTVYYVASLLHSYYFSYVGETSRCLTHQCFFWFLILPSERISEHKHSL